jgi:membrane-associated phospholipid phosphatase
VTPSATRFPNVTLAARHRVVCALLALLTFAGITVGVAAEALTGMDQSVAGAAGRPRVPGLYWVARAGFSLGQNWMFPLISAVLAVLLAARRRTLRPLLALAGVFLVQNVVVGAAKIWAGRRPPVTGNPYLHAVTEHVTQRMSYPSGHAANIVVYTAVLGLLLAALTGEPRWIPRMLAVTITAVAICVSCMLYLGFHWLTDALAGLALGIALRCGLSPAFDYFLRRPA